MTANRPDYLSEEWGALRELVLKRDGYSCRNCGFGDQLQVHHWLAVPEHRDGTDDRGYATSGNPAITHPSGLVTLCELCHEALTRARTERAVLRAPSFLKAAGLRACAPTNNVFELWKLNGEQLPLRVVKETWSRSVPQFYEVEKIEIRKWPYGTAWGRYVREDEIGDLTKIPNAGTYSWRMYRDPKA